MSKGYEIKKMRKNVTDAFKARGFALVVRRMWKPRDFAEGLVAHCHVCWDEDGVYEQGRNDCPNCYGTGFEGGYQSPVFMWGNILWGSYDDKREKGGWFELESGSLQAEYSPLLYDGDLVWPVKNYDGTTATEVDKLVTIDGPVTYVTERGAISSVQTGGFDFYGQIISQSASVKFVPDNDNRQDMAFS